MGWGRACAGTTMHTSWTHEHSCMPAMNTQGMSMNVADNRATGNAAVQQQGCCGVCVCVGG
jgi:hypothetical protein